MHAPPTGAHFIVSARATRALVTPLVCLGGRSHLSRATYPNFTNFRRVLAVAAALVFLWRRCDTLSKLTSGFVDEVPTVVQAEAT